MSIETRLRETGPRGGGGGGSSNSGGLAGTGGFYAVWSSDPLLSNEKIITAGANITLTTDATTITIAATTGVAAASGGLMGTANFLVVWSSDPLLSNEKILSARSAVIIATDPTGIYVSATSDIPLARLGTSQYFRLQEYANFAMSPGLIAGGVISGSATSFSVTSGNGLLKATDSNVDTLLFIDFPAFAITATTQNTTKFIGVVYSGGVPQVIQRTTQAWDLDTEFPLGVVVNDSGSLAVLNNPWISADNMANVIERFDSIAALERDNRTGGLILADSGTRRVIVSAGTILSRMSEFGISAINTTVAGSGTFTNYYRDGAGGWNKELAQVQWDSANYDDGSGTLAAIPALQYSSKWVYVMADSSLAILYGQDVDPAPAIIFDESPPSSVPDKILYEGILIGRYVFQAGASAATRVETAFGTPFTSAQVEDHGELAGLADNDHPQYQLTATTATFASSAGYYAVWSSDPLLSNEKVITAGSSVTLHTDATAIYINATTGASASSGGLAGTGWYYIVGSNASGLPFSKVIAAGSSVTTHTDATAIYINATTGASASSAGLAGTGSFYAVWSSDPLLSNEKVITAGSSVTLHTDGAAIYINATTGGGASNTNIGTGGFINLPVQSAKLYSSTSAARIDAGTAFWRLLFSPTTQQYGIWQFVLPFDYSGSPACQIVFASGSSLAVAKSVNWIVDQWGLGNSQNSIYIDTFGGTNNTTIALSAGYSAGLVHILTVPLANTNSFAAGNIIRLRVSSSAGNVTGNQELVGLGLYYRAGTQTIATGSAGLAGTGENYVVWSADAELINEKVLTAGEGISLDTAATTISVVSRAKDENWWKMYSSNTSIALGQSLYAGGGANNATALGTQAMSINTMTAIHFVVTRSMRVDTMAILCTATGAGCLIRLAVYTNSADNVLQPFQIVGSSGQLLVTPNVLTQFQLNETLSSNSLYWFVLDVGTAAATVRSVALAGAFPILGLNSGIGTIWKVAINSGKLFSNPLPATWGAGYGYVTLASIPAIVVRPSI